MSKTKQPRPEPGKPVEVMRAEDPPPVERSGTGEGSPWPSRLRAIAAEGGAWVRVVDYTTSKMATAAVSRARRYYDRENRFEFTVRRVGGVGAVYVRLKPSPTGEE